MPFSTDCAIAIAIAIVSTSAVGILGYKLRKTLQTVREYEKGLTALHNAKPNNNSNGTNGNANSRHRRNSIYNQIDVLSHLSSQNEFKDDRDKNGDAYRRLVDNSPVPIAVYRKAKWVYANQACFDLIGAQNLNELIGKPVLEFIKPEHRELVKRKMRKCNARSKEVKIIKPQIVRMDGKVLDVEVVAIPTIYGGKTSGQLVIRDLSEQKRLQEEVEKAHRLEAAGRMASQIAHDFNNILTPLVNYPTLIRNTLPGNHPAVEMLQKMEMLSKRMSEINQQLLTMGRRVKKTMKPFDLVKSVKNLISSMSLPDNVTIKWDMCVDDLMVLGSETQLSRVFMNLIKNAQDAMQDDGVITIKSETVTLRRPLNGYSSVEKGDYVKLDISDTGKGIPPEILDKIFKPFFTTKNMDNKLGSGLGLSIVREIIKDHNGYIVIKSEVGKGTTFSLYFPKLSKEKSAEEIKSKSEELDPVFTQKSDNFEPYDPFLVQPSICY